MKSDRLALWLGKVLPIAVWGVGIALCIVFREDISVERILEHSPHNRFLAVLVILGLFALKSVSVVVYAGILYTASGLLFPLPIALAVSVAGTLVMVAIPYWIGGKIGAPAVERILQKYPRARRLREIQTGNDFLFACVVRTTGLPSDVVSLYMGAIGLKAKGYLLGSCLGLLPMTVNFTIMGHGISDVRSPKFWIPLALQMLLCICSVLLYGGLRKKQRQETAEGSSSGWNG